jgi:glycine cleavage system H protein
MNLDALLFTKTHEWISISGDTAVMGISDFAVKLLTDIVFLSLPEPGKHVQKGETIGEIESVKAVSDLYAPLDGEIIETNTSLPDHLELLSDSPFEKAWIARIRLTNLDQVGHLMSFTDYLKHCEHSAH